METIITAVVCFALLIGAIVFVATCMRLSAKGSKVNGEIEPEEISAEDEPIEGEDLSDEEYVAIPARVMDMKCEGKGAGNAKNPHYHVFYNVTFLTDHGETVAYSVGKEVFDRLSIHMTGDLVTVNGNFFDFSKGEEIE